MYKTVPLIFIAFSLFGCAGQQVVDEEIITTDEARQLALEFKKQNFRPPERTITDLREYYEGYAISEKLDCRKEETEYQTRQEKMVGGMFTGIWIGVAPLLYHFLPTRSFHGAILIPQ